MTESKKGWWPKDLTLAGNIIWGDLIHGLTGLGAAYPLYPEWLDEKSIRRSFRGFIDKRVRAGSFKELVCQVAEKRPDLDPNKFILRTYFSRGAGTKPYDYFYFDGEFNLVLIYDRPKETPWLEGVCTTFTLLENFLKYYPLVHGLNKDGLRNDDLIIFQLQARGNGQELKKTFANFRWERLLVGMICQWASDTGFPRVLFLPSKNNKWRVVNENDHGTAYLRYDVTAQRLGFRRMHENGPYVLDLTPKPILINKQKI